MITISYINSNNITLTETELISMVLLLIYGWHGYSGYHFENNGADSC